MNCIQSKVFYKQLRGILHKHQYQLRYISHVTKISYSTLWRWQNGINTHIPHGEILSKFLLFTCDIADTQYQANYYGGEIAKVLMHYFPERFNLRQNLTIAQHLVTTDNPDDVKKLCA